MKLRSETYILVEDSAEEPVTLDEVKAALRIDGDDYDAILEPLIKTAREIAEKITGRDFINKTWKLLLDEFPCEEIEIRKSKLQSITFVKYYDKDNVQQTLNSSVYAITESDSYSKFYKACNQSFPESICCRKQAVEIRFISGYGAEAEKVPQALRTAIISMIAALYQNAGDCAEGGAGQQAQFKSLLAPFILAQKMVIVW